jgi:hypothetical protein
MSEYRLFYFFLTKEYRLFCQKKKNNNFEGKIKVYKLIFDAERERESINLILFHSCRKER